MKHLLGKLAHAVASGPEWVVKEEGRQNRFYALQESLNELAGRQHSSEWAWDELNPHGPFERDRGHSQIHEQQRFAPIPPPGMRVPGNIALDRRPIVLNPDGTLSSLRSISFGTNRGEVLVPTVVNGHLVSNQQAIDHYHRTGQHLGIFDSPAAADRFAIHLHNQQAAKFPDWPALGSQTLFGK